MPCMYKLPLISQPPFKEDATITPMSQEKTVRFREIHELAQCHGNSYAGNLIAGPRHLSALPPPKPKPEKLGPQCAITNGPKALRYLILIFQNKIVYSISDFS